LLKFSAELLILHANMLVLWKFMHWALSSTVWTVLFHPG